MDSDVVVAGGSLAGLLCAREVASRGHSVTVLEEDHEIGTPEHCGGLVSLAGLAEIGAVPPGGACVHAIGRAEITSPAGRTVAVPAARQGVVSVDRRALDKQVAWQAQRAGAVILTGTRFGGASGGEASAGRLRIRHRMLVDARGAPVPGAARPDGVIPSAQFEVYAPWIRAGTVEVMLDAARYPGFFAWVIPAGDGRGRVGVAGRRINVARAMGDLLDARGGTAVRRIFAPVWVGGPAKSFVGGDTVTVGDAAGQSKPTTAGGIYTSGMGGIYAGQAVSRFLETGERAELARYRERWMGRFGAEFERQLLARRVLERLDNGAIERIIGAVSAGTIREISERDGFDFHAGAIVRMLGAAGSARAAAAVAGSELRRLLGTRLKL